MSPSSLPIPDFQDAAQNLLRDEILVIIDKVKVQYDKSIVGVVSFVPIYFNFGSITHYSASDRLAVLRSIKTNVNAICKQFETSMEKMDAFNKTNVHNYLLRMVINNVPGKASTSKKCTFFPDGTCEISTVFEDNLNCQYYLEKKVLQTLNEFRPTTGSSVVQKVEAFVQPTTPPPEPVSQPQAQVIMNSAANVDLSIPTYQNGTWENVKSEIITLCKPLRLESVLPGPPFEMPVSVDWQSIGLSGSDYSIVLKAIKNNIPSLLKQIIPGIQKVDEFRKPIIRDFLISIILQNVAGKASTSKKCFLSAEGSLVLVVPFEDNLNCSYYFEKKITQGLNEFSPPQGITGLPRATPVIQSVQVPPPPPVQQPPQPVHTPSYNIGQFQQVQQPVYQPSVVQPPPPQPPVHQQPIYHQPIYHQPQVVPQQPVYQPQYTAYQQPIVEQPKPVVVVPKVREPPKEKGRPEMEEKPNVEDPLTVFLIREIEYIVSQMKVVDDRDQYFGVPVYIDWKSIIVYPSPVKQATVVRNVNLVIYRLLRDVIGSIKLSCTDGINKDNIVEYLRSVTVQHFQGSSPSLKKVVYEDGHLSIQTTFEDFGNCALYFDSKVIQALQSKPSQPAAKKPDALSLIKEELPIRLMAHQGLLDKKGNQITPKCLVEMDFSFLTVKGNESIGAEHNLISSTNPLLADLFAAIITFSDSEIAILMKEITKVSFHQAVPGKTIFDRRNVVFLDNGYLQITTFFEDKMEGIKSFKEKFMCIFRSRLYKVIIRDRLVPELKKMIDTAVRVQYKDNYLDQIKVNDFSNYSCNVQFDWQLVDKEALDPQVKIYSSIVANLEQQKTFPSYLDNSIKNICSYDVGKNAFLPNVNFILRNIIKSKEEQIKFVTNNTWEFYISFHDPAVYRVTQSSLTTLFKETLLVAFPCAVQDCFPIVREHVQQLASSTGKNVPIVVHYDDFRKFERFATEQYSYKQLDNIVCSIPHIGLNCITTLCKDAIVKKEYTTKVNSIEIHYDTQNKVKAHRSEDPDVVAKLDNGVLTFTMNFAEARNPGGTRQWDFQFEFILGTRPLKIARAIENAKFDLNKTTGSLSTLIGKPVTIVVDHDTFITHPKFQLALEEPVYTKVISSFYALVEAGWLKDIDSTELLTYETLKKSLQAQLNKITFKISCESSQRNDYEFNLESGGNLVIGLNLNSACKVTTQKWRLELERVFKLRDLRVQEEIAKRIDITQSKSSILSTIGKQAITITIDWQSIITNPDFSSNKVDYVNYLHQYSETVLKELRSTNGFGKLCIYDEVKALVQQRISSITIQATTSDGFTVNYDKSSKSLVCMVGIRNLLKYLPNSSGNYEEYGRKIENAIDVRVDCIKAYIKRNEPEYISSTKARLREGIETDIAFTIDWSSIIEHPSFSNIQDPVPTLKRILLLSQELHPIVQLCKENYQAKDALKGVRQFTLEIDGSSRIDESEFTENNYGVDWAKIAWKGLPAKNHILFSANLNELKKDPHNLEIELKVEALITPDRALDRYQRKMDEIHRQEEKDSSDRFRRDQMRMDEKMLDASRENNRQLESLNRKFRR